MNEKSVIYCWEIRSDDLNIYLASSKRGALRVGLSLKRAYDCPSYFKKAFPSCSVIKDYNMNRPLIEAWRVKESGWSFLGLWGWPMGISTSFLPSLSEKTTSEWILEKVRKWWVVTSFMARSLGLDGTTY